MNVNLIVPEAVADLVDRLEEVGFETWTVGGAVRDALRGKPGEREDWDLATRATPREMRRLFRHTVPLGVEYGTVGVFGRDGALYEVTTFRHDVITYGRKAVVGFATSLDEDLARRDFTINAIAWHPRRRELRDPHGGLNDLRDSVLRAVGDPAARFREDYLRVLRGLRFAGSLRLDIDPKTWTGMVEAVPGLASLSMERIREELLKVLVAPRPSRALALYESSGARAVVLPGLRRGLEPEALATVDAAKGQRVTGHRAELRLAVMLLFGIGPRADPGTVAEILCGLRFSKAETRRIATAAGSGLGPPPYLVRDAAARRRWLARRGARGARDVLRVWIAALRAGTSPATADDMCQVLVGTRADLHAGVPLSVGDLAIAGRDLLAMGWTPGAGIGRTLRRLLEAVWRDPALNDRATLRKLAVDEEVPSP